MAIGRNEGERLRVCLESAIGQAAQVVYVDSGSTDGSVEMARGLGAIIVELDPDVPFTAARARNAGFERLLAGSEALLSGSEGLSAGSEGLRYVQFVDGDCELDPRWIDTARNVMETEPGVVVVCGRRAERYPRDTVYNLLCDMEWDTPIGPADECGGDALMRVEALRAAGGYRDDLIAGEEPELCARLRAAGGQVLRIDAPMTLHDARLDAFSQWWTRSVRSGYANAEAVARGLLGDSPRGAREVRSTWIWGTIFPFFLVLMILTGQLVPALAIASVFAIQVVRIARSKPKPDFEDADQWRYAVACVLGKLPNAQGQLRYWVGRITGRRSALIEYKGADVADPDAGGAA